MNLISIENSMLFFSHSTLNSNSILLLCHNRLLHIYSLKTSFETTSSLGISSDNRAPNFWVISIQFSNTHEWYTPFKAANFGHNCIVNKFIESIPINLIRICVSLVENISKNGPVTKLCFGVTLQRRNSSHCRTIPIWNDFIFFRIKFNPFNVFQITYGIWFHVH